MSSRDKARSSLFASTAASTSRRLATKKTTGSSSASLSSAQTKPQTSKQTSGSAKKSAQKTHPLRPTSSTSESEKTAKSAKSKSVINSFKKTPSHAQESSSLLTGSRANSRRQAKDSSSQDGSRSSSQEMTITSPLGDQLGSLAAKRSHGEPSTSSLEQETNIDNSQASDDDDDESTTLLDSHNATSSESESYRAALASQVSTCEDESKAPAGTSLTLPADWEQHVDKEGLYFWHRPTGLIQRHRPSGDELGKPLEARKPIVLYHDDEEINQSSVIRRGSRTSSDEDDYTALESGAALTLADEATANTLTDVNSFVVYPMGCCDFDETQLVSINSTKAIQRCILRLLNTANQEENQCWGYNQSQPILMRLMEDHIQFKDISGHSLLRSQPIQTIRTWAVDDDNNFAFVVEEQPQIDTSHLEDSIDYALLNAPTFVCYVFSSADENDDMSLKVATKLNKQINRYREQLTSRMEAASKKPQQMIDTKPVRLLAATNNRLTAQENDQTDADEDLEDQFVTTDANAHDDNDDDDLANSSEITLKVRYIGKVQVPRPMGIDVLNVAIDKCLADASKIQMERLLSRSNSDCNQGATNAHSPQTDDQLNIASPLAEVKIHVSPSSVIVENERTGEIVVECRIRYLTFMGISRRDIRWCGFIMQNTTNQSFVAHCFECYPTAGEVCEAIQMSCSRMYEKMVKKEKMKQQVDEATSIVPKSSKIRDTLAKTLSRIKLTPII